MICFGSFYSVGPDDHAVAVDRIQNSLKSVNKVRATCAHVINITLLQYLGNVNLRKWTMSSVRPSNSGTRIFGRVGYNHLISNKREWNNCFIKNAPQI